MTAFETITDCDDEDVLDVIPVIEKSFRIRFSKNAFADVSTVGEFVAVVHSYVDYPHHESCTCQSVFYRIRDFIASRQALNPQNVFPGSLLDELFPAADRRKQVKALKRSLGVKTDLLSPPEWAYFSNVIGLILSLVALFFSAIAGLSGIAFFIVSMVVTKKLAKNFTVYSVRELVEKISNENYLAVRRQAGTVNRNEIWDTVVNILSARLGVDSEYITPESRFIWAEQSKA